MATRISAEAAASKVQSGMWLDYGGAVSQPDAFDAALGARAAELENVRIRSAITLRSRAVLEADPEGRAFQWISTHFSGYDRQMHDKGRATYMPLNLGEVPDYYRRFIPPVDIVILKALPMDQAGYFNLSCSTIWTKALIERARIVIIEETTGLPRVCGAQDEVAVHVDQVDFVITGDNALPPELPNPAPSEVDQTVARLIAENIDDGACLQIGIGGMPNAVCSLIAESGLRDLGVHTEMLTDGIVDLYQAGMISGANKRLDPGKITCTFALGSRHLYEAIDHNPAFEFQPVDQTNLPHMIMQNPKATAINNTTQIDLTGQAASESDGHRHLTGTGGQAQFVRGAYGSEDGKSFICLSSVYEKDGKRQSRIVLGLTPGNAVTTTRGDMMYVVTEYGIVNLKGKSIAERAKAMIGLAHPDFREALEREAHARNLIPKGFFSAALSAAE